MFYQAVIAAGYHLMKRAVLEGKKKKPQARTAKHREEERGAREVEEEAPSGSSNHGTW